MARKQGIISSMALALFLVGACGDNETADPIVVEDDPVENLTSFGDEQASTGIQTLSGCFFVRYHFVENGQNDFFFEDNIEYMDVSAQGDGFVARNFLVVPAGPPGTFMAFLHWVQEWTPTGTADVWNFAVKDGEGNLRYETEGVWRFNQFESVPAMAVKPNRDSERADYDVLERRNAIQLAGSDWIQSELNVKMLDGAPVASELGWIVYGKQTDETPCDPAKDIANQLSLTQTDKNWRPLMEANDLTSWVSPL